MLAKHPDMQPGPHLCLSVSDTGTGMTPEVMEQAFDPFFSTKGKEGGSGMGLAVVHGIVKGYGGGISVYSEVGLGSTFNIFLPRVEGEQEQGRGPAEPIAGEGERILIIEDEAIQLQSFATALERLGYRPTARTDSREALADFRENPGDFDLVITDQTMPKMTGSELAEAILRIRPDLPIILCTGFSEIVDGEKAKLIGIREFILKPFSLSDISVTIRRALAVPMKE
jgi:CheY-like chemotaxis protein